ncbi:MAG: MerR family transcriptional regulator [Desulfobacteraceae bacterium 4572_87]|nr:MAG: MerR family transcriptional regulator [Desulfobacteraceae bacterium 4572_87]
MHRKKDKNEIDKESTGYFISTVSREVNLSQKTIREYEKMGLVNPRREPRTNNRIYSDFDIAQIRQVSHLIHNEGFTLPCLKRLLQSAPCWNVFDCDAKEECSAYNAPYVPCYETRKTVETHCDDSCDRCAIHVNRPKKRSKILESPVPKEAVKNPSL